MESKRSEVCLMKSLEITVAVLGAIIVFALLANAKDIARYIRISTM
jgi:hypothetical protein